MIELRNLSRTFPTPAGPFHALTDVSLDAAPGTFVAISGRSGSGKSTLLHLAGGIDVPTAGDVRVGGTALSTLGSGLDAWRGRHVGFIFQFFQLLPTLTAAENVMLPMDFARSFPGPERRRRARQLLEQVGVAAEENKLPSALSGGQQQRVAIARALANRPEVVLADEPTGNLDSTTARDVVALLRALADAGTTVLVATHDREVAAAADRHVTLVDGRIG